MELTLFDFDFETSEQELFSEVKVKEVFSELQDISKERMNGYYIHLDNLPKKMLMYIDKFEKNSWIEKRESGGLYILDEFVKYHTFNELIDEYEDILSKAVAQHNVCWYENILPIVNHACSPIRYKSEELKELIYQKKEEIIKKVVIDLGLKHFLNVPSSRGLKMTAFGSKWSKENVLPVVIENVKGIDDYDAMKEFFYNNFFFFGRRDWDWGYKNIAPYPEFKRLMPSYLELAALSEATDSDDIKLIFDHVGYSSGGRLHEQSVIYPKGWSYEKYKQSLTDGDKELIQEDRERLNRLHNGKES